MGDGGQIHRGEILTLQEVVETVLGTKRALLLQIKDSVINYPIRSTLSMILWKWGDIITKLAGL